MMHKRDSTISCNDKQEISKVMYSNDNGIKTKET